MFRKHRFLIFIIIILVLGLIFSPILPIKNAVYTVFSPITKNLNSAAQKGRGFLGTIKSIKSLSAENQNLKNENQELQANIAHLAEVEHENRILKEELGFYKKDQEKSLISAQITSKSVSAYLRNITINKGAKDGVQKNQAVISQGYLVGIIFEVADNFSQVQLISDSKTIIPVVLQDSRGTGLMKASLKGIFIEDIPIDIKINIGEIVLTSDLGETLPRNIIIGKVEAITSHDSEIFQTVKINSPVDFSKLEMVFIVK